jgi:hypothetical protein
MDKPRVAYAAWKQADALARDIEATLAEAWERYETKTGGPPTEDLLKEVSRLRSAANDKLTVALLEIGCVRR